MKNILIGLIEIVIIASLVTFESGLWDFLWLIPILAILIVDFLLNYKIEENRFNINSEIYLDSVTLKDIVKVKLFDLIVLVLFVCILFLPFELLPIIRSKNIITIPLFVILNMNVFRPTLGAKFLKTKIKNCTILTKFKILLNNFFIVSPIYFYLFFKIHSDYNDISEKLFELLSIINLFSFFIRFLKNKSLFEFILGIDYYKDNKREL